APAAPCPLSLHDALPISGFEPGLDTTQVQTPSAATYPNGCHIVEVEIDPASGVVTLVNYTIVDDFGGVINPLLLEGQVHGGIVRSEEHTSELQSLTNLVC